MPNRNRPGSFERPVRCAFLNSDFGKELRQQSKTVL
jgi:hypothetical protein